jgi:hypothetical protein
VKGEATCYYGRLSISPILTKGENIKKNMNYIGLKKLVPPD